MSGPSCYPCSPCEGYCDDGVGTTERTMVRLQADQPVVSVPVYQDVLKRDKYIEVPQIEISDTIIPRVYKQSAVHDVPKMGVMSQDQYINISATKLEQRDVEVPIDLGYAPKFVPRWDVREVPRPVPKYYGEQEVIEIEVPEIQYKDKYVEKEVVVDIKEKMVPKITEEIKEVEVLKYEWKEQFQDVPIYKYVPKFDVELDCPPPLIVPYPQKQIVKDKPESICWGLSNCCQPQMEVHKTGQSYDSMRMDEQTGIPYGTLSPEQYQQYIKQQTMQQQPFAGQTVTTDMINSLNKSYTREYNLEGEGGDTGNVLKAQLTMKNLPPGPVYPMPSPQLNDRDRMVSSHIEQQSRQNVNKEEKKSFFSWLLGKKEDKSTKKDSELPTSFQYPENMPTDFAEHFRQQQQQQEREQQLQQEEQDQHDIEEEVSGNGETELEPSVTYKGAINKPAIFGGVLDPISFKLHAIEIHQYVPLPNVKDPEFVKAIPNGFIEGDTSGMANFFGGAPAGWADPDITGFPAPMMNQCARGNIQIQSPLVNQLSHQFSKQGYGAGFAPNRDDDSYSETSMN